MNDEGCIFYLCKIGVFKPLEDIPIHAVVVVLLFLEDESRITSALYLRRQIERYMYFIVKLLMNKTYFLTVLYVSFIV